MASIVIDCQQLLSISRGVHGHPHDKSPGYPEIDFRNPKMTDHAWTYRSVKLHAATRRLQRKSCRPMTCRTLPQDDLTAQSQLKFLLITQHEVPIHKHEWSYKKKVEWSNKERQMCKWHETCYEKSCRLVNAILHSRTSSLDPNSKGKEITLANSGSRVGLSQLFNF